ncbi:jg10468 [Pararge aegeria aegeria]|uniref:Jg10468 protein n=1 Tax=Pararge aegeria aegeria TaxID=348720 RepID=A0A8S4RED2_9NEOP|nr:jg10468 [Pararge aegeria aegeria]
MPFRVMDPSERFFVDLFAEPYFGGISLNGTTISKVRNIMASVWKRLQRVNKRAAKFQYTASYHRIDVELTPKWKPNKLSIVWTRRSRRVLTEPLEWEPSLKDPLKGSVIFAVPENQTVAVTLFRDARTNELEDKDWTFVLEDERCDSKMVFTQHVCSACKDTALIFREIRRDVWTVGTERATLKNYGYVAV